MNRKFCPPVSVVIPAYNADKYIEECIRSVMIQFYRPIEIIVVDDHSTDNTNKIVTTIIQKIEDHQEAHGGLTIKLFRLMRNMGAAYALDFGCRRATGKYIAWLSADDTYIGMGKIRRQVMKMYEERSDWSYVREFVSGTSELESTLIKPTYFPKTDCLDWLFEKYNLLRFFCLFWRNPIQGSSFMITSKAYEKYGGFNPDMVNADADRDFWFRLSLCGAILTVVKGYPEVFYRTHPTQLSNDKKTMGDGYKKANRRAMRNFIKKLFGGNPCMSHL
jgi:glycosyltransferase involved in cell wall biosynthesis